MRTPLRLTMVAMSFACLYPARASLYTPPLGPSQSDFGGTGLLQTPTARIAREGEFSLNVRNNKQYRFYSTSVSLFPWMEATLRYTDVRTRLYSHDLSFSGRQTYKDKSFDMKFRLWKEDYWLPQVALGKRDLGGTGLFDSEYIVASKMAGPLDFTLGLGWGYIGHGGNIKNPFCAYSDTFCHRPDGGTAAGDIKFNDVFRGPAAFFGGIAYQTPWSPLRLKLDYDGNDYQNDFAGKLKQRSPFNVGGIYRATDWLDITASYERGNTFMFGVTLRKNLNDMRPSFVNTPLLSPRITTVSTEHADLNSALPLLREYAGFDEAVIRRQGPVLAMSGQQDRYRLDSEGIARANAVLLMHAPLDVETLSITQMRHHVPLVTTETSVASLKQKQAGEPLGQEKILEQQRTDPVSVFPETDDFRNADDIHYSFSPVLNQSFGGPENFYLYQLGGVAGVKYWVSDHIALSGGLFGNIVNNYAQFKNRAAPKDPRLPPVRTHVRDYASNNVYVNHLQLTYFTSMAEGLYGQFYGGYLETMFGGVGGEVLYCPLDTRWAVGMDANVVEQRDWNNMMTLNRYKALTGHVTAYWTPPVWADSIRMKLSVGQYLAKDKGMTLDVAKRFSNGVLVGGYATLTNASHEAYGEGAFTKGFYVAIPLDLMTTTPTRAVPVIRWTPLTRDGGQMLGREYSLYGMTEERQ